ncbi:ubiquinol oxidase subunit II [Sphingomonas bacterium]|uniref:ubiquinol oxidase subunit II n=1 Tax=Sphingomonas bacterium TaxID=1895847 RepID=UPI0020C64B19|nr:ubiquinol oxidase subunit II [Sphingomonas bacterium]
MTPSCQAAMRDTGSTTRSRSVSLCRAASAAAVSFLVDGCAKGVLDPAGPVAADEKTILFNATVIMMALVVPTIILALVFAWWFRAGNERAIHRPDFAYSGRIELLVWSVPILVIIFLGGLTWISSHRLDPFKPLPATAAGKPIEVQVVSLDWKWLFIYPGYGVASVNRLVVPAARPVHFSLTSASVMNSFFVPQLGSQIYTMNGMVTQLNLQADKPGSYFGQSTHFSGDGFSDMYFHMDAVSPAQFAGWVAGAKAAGPALDAPAYAALARQSTRVKPFTYRAVMPVLFQAVAAQRLAPAAGPQKGRGGPQVSPGDNS